jgi:HEAT repeat protein
MAVSMEDVRAALDPDEPDYQAAASMLGEGAVSHLSALVEGEDPMLASKAAYLAGLIGGDDATAVVVAAAHHDDATVRVAAASSTEHLTDEETEAVLVDLVGDSDAGVRKLAHRALPDEPSEELEAALEHAPAPDDGADAGAATEPMEALSGDRLMPGESSTAGGVMPGESPGLMPAESAGQMNPDGEPTDTT